MPETRYIETYEQGTGRLLSREPYEVSDEELARQRRHQRLANILDEVDEVKSRLAALDELKVRVGKLEKQ